MVVRIKLPELIVGSDSLCIVVLWQNCTYLAAILFTVHRTAVMAFESPVMTVGLFIKGNW